MWLVIPVALGAEPPERPLAPAVAEGECSRAYSLRPGDSLDCEAVCMPLSTTEDLLATEVWATQVADLYRITTSEMQQELDLCAWQVERLETELVAASLPVPFWERPTTVLGVGVIGGILGMMSTGWVLQAINE